MTPHKATHGRGSFVLDRIFTGIGRIRRSSGTTDKRVFRGINGMLDELYIKGLHGSLEAIRDGRLKPIAAYAVFRTGNAELVPDAPALTDAKTLWAAWVGATPNADTRRMRAGAWKHLAGYLEPNAPLSALPGAVANVREALRDHPPAFNRVLAAAQACVRDRLGKRHALYDQVTDVGRLVEVTIKRKAPSIERAIEIRDGLAKDASALWWTLYVTGMGPKEHDGMWELDRDRIAIHGTKRERRDRIVPRVAGCVRRSMGWKQFRAALAPFAVQIYDARRGFRHLMEEARIPRTRLKQYMGHRPADVTDGYGQVELAEFLAGDADAMRSAIVAAEQRIAAKQKTRMRRA